MEGPSSALASIARDLKGLTKKLGLSPDLWLVERAWDQEIGGLREDAPIAALDQGTLVIEVDSSTVMQEISLRRRELVRKVNQHLPVPFIRQIVVRIQNHGKNR